MSRKISWWPSATPSVMAGICSASMRCSRACRRDATSAPRRCREAIGKLKEQGLSILLVEQNAALALKLVDYVHVMSKGQVVYSARPQELWANDEIKSNYLGI